MIAVGCEVIASGVARARTAQRTVLPTSVDSWVAPRSGSAGRHAVGEHTLVAALARGACRNVRCWRLSARGLLDQQDAIAVGVTEVRHRRHGTLAAPHVLKLDAARAELGHRCLEVGRVEAKRGLATRLRSLLAHRRHKGDHRIRTGWSHLDPAEALAELGVRAHLEAEFVAVERKRAILIAHREVDGAHAGDVLCGSGGGHAHAPSESK